MKENLQTKFDNFEGPYDFSGTEWQGLEARLNKRDLVPLGMLTLLAAVLLLGLLGSSIMLWRQNTALTQRLTTLESPKITSEKAVATTTDAQTTTVLVQTDTIRKRRIIYQYDTIYRKITVVETQYLTPQYQQSKTSETTTIGTKETTDKTAQTRLNASTIVTSNPIANPTSNVNSTSDLTINSMTVPTTNLDNNHTTRPLTDAQQSKNGVQSPTPPQYLGEKLEKNNQKINEFSKNGLPATADSLKTKEIIANKTPSNTADSTLSEPIVTAKKPFTKDSITMKKFPFDSLDIVRKDKRDEKKEDEKVGKTHPKYAFKMLPIYVGGVMGVPIWSQAAVIGQNGNQYGLKVEAVATERVRFFAEVNYTENGEAKSTDLGMLPTEIKKPTPEPGLSFKYWETSSVKSFNYLLGIQYQWREKEKFQPYIAAAFNATTNLPFEVDFEYIDRLTSVEKKYLQPVTTLQHFNRIYGALGLRFNAFPNGQLAAETYFTTPFDKDKAVTPTQVGLKIGVFYFIR